MFYKQLKFLFVFFFVSTSQLIASNIISLPKISDLTFNLASGDLLLLDIDQTLLTPGIDKYKDPVTAIETDIADTIKRLRSNGVIILALTAREPKFADQTEQQLKSIDLNFSDNIHINQIDPSYFAHAALTSIFKNGILYTPRVLDTDSEKRSTKGQALVALLDFFALPLNEQIKLGDESNKPNTQILDSSQIERIVFVDDLELNNEAVEKNLAASAYNTLTLLNYNFKATEKDTEDEAQKLYEYKIRSGLSFPPDIKSLKFTQTLMGGTGGVHIMVNDEGDKFTLKCNTGNIDHYKEELAADALTLSLGLSAPDIALYNHRPDDPHLTEDICPSGQPFYRLARFIQATETAAPEKLKQKLRERFVADAFLANWDVVDGKGKNAILSDDNQLYSIDHGGALRYRAKGEPKADTEGWTAAEVSELETMRHPRTSPDGADIYDDFPDEMLEYQAKDIIAKEGKLLKVLQDIHKVIKISQYGDLYRMLTDRIENLRSLFGRVADTKSTETALAHRFEPAVPGKTSAGTFIFTEINGEYYTLLGKRIKHEWWGNLGGKSEPGQALLSDTAAQENFEESNKLISLFAEELHTRPSHDLIAGDNLYRMYFVDYTYIPAKDFVDALGTTGEHSREYTDFMWVKISDLYEAVLKSETLTEEDLPTIAITAPALPENPTSQKKEVILHPPFFQMLRQRPVLKIMHEIINKKPLKAIHTRGEAETNFPEIDDFNPDTFEIAKRRWEEVEPAHVADKVIITKTKRKISGKKALEKTQKPVRIQEKTRVKIKEPLSYEALKARRKAEEEERQKILNDPLAKETIKKKEAKKDKKAKKAKKIKQNEKEVRIKIKELSPYHVPIPDQEELYRNILNKTQSLIELKSQQKVEPYESAKNTEMKNKLKDLPLTQSEVHMKHLMGPSYIPLTDENATENIPKNIHAYLTRGSRLRELFTDPQKSYAITGTQDHPFIKAMTEAWLEERKGENRGKIFAYHGVDPLTGLLYDLFTEVRRQFLIVGLNESVVTRSLDSAFEGIFTIQDFIREQLIKQEAKRTRDIENYAADFQQKGLSANMFLFGSDGHETSSTARYVFDGFSSSPPPFDKLLDYLKQNIGVDFDNQELAQLLKNFRIDKTGRLFQFIFEPEIAEKLMYSSYAQGRAVELQGLPGYPAGYNGAFGVVETARRKLEDLQNSIKEGEIDRLQFRIFVQPQKILNQSMVKVKNYWGNIPPTAEDLNAYQQKLKSFAKQITLQFLRNKVLLPEGMLTSVDQQKDKLTAIQRLTKYVQEGLSGEAYTTQSSASLLPAALYHKNIPLIKNILKRNPDIKLDQELTYVAPDGRSYKIHPWRNIFLNAYSENAKELQEENRQYQEIIEIIAPKITPVMATVMLPQTLMRNTAYEILVKRFKASEQIINLHKDSMLGMIDRGLMSKPLAMNLIRLGFKTTGKNKNGQSFFRLALNNKDYEAAKFLIDQGVDVNAAIDDEGSTLLHLFAKPTPIPYSLATKSNVDTLTFLLENGAKIDAENRYKQTPFFLSVLNGNQEAVQLFLDKGVDINMRDHSGNTALHLATKSSTLSMMKFLIDKGADPHVKNNDGETAYDVTYIREKEDFLAERMSESKP